MKPFTKAKASIKLVSHEGFYEDLTVKSTLLNYFRGYGTVAAVLFRRTEFCIARRLEEQVAELIAHVASRVDGKKHMSISTKGASSGNKKPGSPNNSSPDCPPETDLPHFHRFRNFNSNDESKKNISTTTTVSSAAVEAKSSDDCEEKIAAKPPILSTATYPSGLEPVLSDNKCIPNSKPVIPDIKRSTNSKPEREGTEIAKKGGSSDSERSMYQEKQHSYRVDFSKVTSAPAPSRQQWWYPDPYTGYYTPEDHFGETSPAPVEEKPKKKKNPTINLTDKKSPGKKGSWWTSMEDLPDSLS